MIDWLSRFKARLKLLSGLLSTIWQSPLRMIRTHAITVLILHEAPPPARFRKLTTCWRSRALDAVTPSVPAQTNQEAWPSTDRGQCCLTFGFLMRAELIDGFTKITDAIKRNYTGEYQRLYFGNCCYYKLRQETDLNLTQ